MIKNKVLTPVLAGVLGVSVVGSGVGYYLVNKDGGDNNKPEQTMDSMKVSLTQIENDLNSSIENVEKAVKGELDYAYDSSLKISFGEGINNAAGNGVNFNFKPMELNTKVKQKGQNSQAEIMAKYNDATLVTLETIVARDSNTGYFRIPELSSSYIKATTDDLQKLFEKTADTIGSTNVNAMAKTQIKAPDINDIDSEKMEKSLKEYIELFKSKLPGKKDGADISGDIDGNKYNYKTVVCSVTGKQFMDAFNAVIDKAASDTDLKKLFDDYMAQQSAATQNEGKPISYAEFISKMKISISDEDLNKAAALDVYYDGEEISGCSLSYDGKTLAKAVVINKDDVNAVDIFVNDNSGSQVLSVKGSAKLVDGTINGAYAFTLNFDGEDSAPVKANLKLDKLVVKDDIFNGTILFTFESTDSYGQKMSAAMNLTGDCSDNKKNIKFTVDVNGKNYVTVEFKLNKTEATDVAVPTSDVFSLSDQYEQYLATCDIDGFKQGINDALGINIFVSSGKYPDYADKLQ